MNNKVYFEFYRDFDEYPLSADFYNSDILKIIKEGHCYFFHHPDEDKMQEYVITSMRTGYYEGYIILTAFSIDTSVYHEIYNEGFVEHQTFQRACNDFFDDCMNEAKRNLDYILKREKKQ